MKKPKNTRDYHKVQHLAEGGSVQDYYFEEIPIDENGHDERIARDLQYKKAVQDGDEIRAGTRFHDGGSRIPGRIKARNDAWEAKRIKEKRHYK